MSWSRNKIFIHLAAVLVVILGGFVFYQNQKFKPDVDNYGMRLWFFIEPNLGETDDKMNEIFKRITNHTTYIQPEDQWGDSENNVISDGQHTIEIRPSDQVEGLEELWIDGENSQLLFENIFRRRCCAMFAPGPSITADERFIFVNYTQYSAELVEIDLEDRP